LLKYCLKGFYIRDNTKYINDTLSSLNTKKHITEREKRQSINENNNGDNKDDDDDDEMEIKEGYDIRKFIKT